MNLAVADALTLAIDFKVGAWNPKAIKCSIAIMSAKCEG
jgi:hypothetical protein